MNGKHVVLARHNTHKRWETYNMKCWQKYFQPCSQAHPCLGNGCACVHGARNRPRKVSPSRGVVVRVFMVLVTVHVRCRHTVSILGGRSQNVHLSLGPSKGNTLGKHHMRSKAFTCIMTALAMQPRYKANAVSRRCPGLQRMLGAQPPPHHGRPCSKGRH